MNNELEKKAYQIFSKLLAFDSNERVAKAKEFCNGLDSKIYQRVLEYLKHDSESSKEGFLSESLHSQSSTLERVGSTIGDCEITELLGRGGQGEVYLATQSITNEAQSTPIQRQVALKIFAPQLSSIVSRERFQKEMKALSNISHENVTKLYDCGVTEDGYPYYIMELVKGKELKSATRGLELKGRLQIFKKICSAVSAIHSHGFIHRDLKPSNILITESHEPKILDFGIVKAVSETSIENEEHTKTIYRILSTKYASPEQIQGEKNLTTQSDIYSLGVILYELLTDYSPYEDLEQGELIKNIKSFEPLKPSLRVKNTGNSVKIHDDLDAICIKALERRVPERYSSVSELENDIQAFFEHRPVLAQKPNRAYYFKRFIRRNRIQTIAASLILLTIILGSIATGIGFYQATESAEIAKTELSKSLERSAKLAYQHGNWKEALEFYQKAINRGHPESERLKFDRLEAFLSLDDPQSLLEQLEKIVIKESQEGHALLLKADAKMALGEDISMAEELLEQAQKKILTEPQKLYIEALLEPNSINAIKKLNQCLEQSPFYHLAHRKKLILLSLLGRYEEALLQAQIMQKMFPSDPNPYWVEATSYAMEGDLKGVNASILKTETQFGGMSEELEKAFITLANAVDELRKQDIWGTGGDPLKLAKSFLLLFKSKGLTDLFQINLSNMKCQKLAWDKVKKLSTLFPVAGTLYPYTSIRIDLKEMVELHPISELYFFDGELAIMLSDSAFRKKDKTNGYNLFREAEESYKNAVKTPALFPSTKKRSLHRQVYAQGNLLKLSGLSKEEKDVLRKNAVSKFHKLVELFEPKAGPIRTIINSSKKDYEFAQTLLRYVISKEPENAETWALAADIEFTHKNFSLAHKYASTVLGLTPNHELALKIMKQSQVKLLELLPQNLEGVQIKPATLKKSEKFTEPSSEKESP